MSHQGCDSDLLVINQQVDMPSQAQCMMLALNTISPDQILTHPSHSDASLDPISPATARTLCAQHCLLTV
ncbi:MAG: hypothetical protein CMJ19_09370 [Phycisphaeraceae bacterium]|nr:hypothetical protein [Phycisphaeraceae bacterium]